jgi:predicted phage terminase large subunit-like protein
VVSDLVNDWDVVYEKAIRDDGSLLFPERLTHEFLAQARKTMGSYLFANQYQNEIIPEGEQTFKKHWLKYYAEIPVLNYTYAFIDPAISEADTADYTALTVVSTDVQRQSYVRHASRQRINPSEIIDLAFEVYDRFHPLVIGVEDVAFQRSIIHFAYEEMRRRDKHLPLKGVKRSPDKTKEMRILSLVPRFEWGSLLLNQGLHDLEIELAEFPRGRHDDMLDSLASIYDIASYPSNPRTKQNERPEPHEPGYESWFIRQLCKRSDQGE